MKKILFVVASMLCCFLLAVMPSCKKESINSPTRPMRISFPGEAVAYYGEMYGVETGAALNVACQALHQVFPEKYSGLQNNCFDIDIDFYTFETIQEVFDYDFEMEDTIMYLFNLTNNNGFVIVNDSLELLAISDTGNLYLSDFTHTMSSEYFYNNPAKSIPTELINREGWREAWCSYIDAPNTIVAPIPPDSINVEWTYRDINGPYVEMNLGQEFPYNAYCPPDDASEDNKCLAGCVPIAITSLLSANNVPSVIEDFSWSDIVANWEYYMEHRPLSSFISNTTYTELNALAKFIHDLGDAMNTQYHVDVSNTNKDMMLAYVHSRWYRNARLVNIDACNDYVENIENHGLTYYIHAGNGIQTMQHAWVLDGTLSCTYAKIEYYRGNPRLTERMVYNDLLHCNFGWEGEYNGYYQKKIFDLSAGPVRYSEADIAMHNRTDNLSYDIEILEY